MSTLPAETKNVMRSIPPDDLEMIETVCGKIDLDKGLTSYQNWILSNAILQQSRDDFVEAMKEHAPTKGEMDYLFTVLTGVMAEQNTADITNHIPPHFLLEMNASTEAKDDQDITSVARTWLANALKVVLTNEDAENLLHNIKNKPLDGYAGAVVPDHRIGAANIWYEVAFPEGRYPGVKPVRDIAVYTGEKSGLVRIKRIAIHAIHAGCVSPFPGAAQYPMACSDEEKSIAADPNFLKSAVITAFVEDVGGHIYTFAGTISYGSQGGARIYRITKAQDAASAWHGDNPRPQGYQGITGLAQFVGGTLAYLISFFGVDHYESMLANNERTETFEAEPFGNIGTE